MRLPNWSIDYFFGPLLILLAIPALIAFYLIIIPLYAIAAGVEFILYRGRR